MAIDVDGGLLWLGFGRGVRVSAGGGGGHVKFLGVLHLNAHRWPPQ